MADALNGRLKVAVLQVSCLERSPHGGQVIVRLLVVVKHKEETLPNFFGLAHPGLILITAVTALPTALALQHWFVGPVDKSCQLGICH